jgi:predicted esterase
MAKEKFASTEVFLVHGLEDELVTEESKKRQEELLLELGKPLKLLTFSGGHELESQMVERIINQEF